MCVCVCVCVCVCFKGSSTRKTLVCASSEDSRESVRSLESSLICADFFLIIVRNLNIFYTYYMYSKKKYGILIKYKMKI